MDFVALRQPGQAKAKLFQLHLKDNEAEAAFVVCTFDGVKRFYAVEELFDRLTFALSYSDWQYDADVEHARYVEGLAKIKAIIAAGEYDKIVLARRSWLAFALTDQLIYAWFDSLCLKYPDACVTLLCVGGKVWVGATPELLVAQVSEQRLVTMALAGTRLRQDADPFAAKEGAEQSLVSDFIRQRIEELGGDSLRAWPVEPAVAGPLVHLRTLIDWRNASNKSLGEWAAALHPTPAVGTMPQGGGLAAIGTLEGFDRQLYAGYFGLLKHLGELEPALFVNLRCAQVFSNGICFYAGAGIVAGSDAEAEWLETQRKIDVIQALLQV